ncbi:rho-related GTP-binding protein RhoN-like [Sarcoptes scabiei]|nr:transcription elongation factor B polypeptide 2-like protein [Sarcoptes scabiei]UXI23351.1 rho-related GTP-binding protein RhoN-like [Sarcoptes scabiei]
MIEGITKVPVNDQRLFKDEQLMDDYKTMAECNLTSNTAKAQSPATIGLAFRNEKTGTFEPLEIIPYSTPPELPDELKTVESGQNAE